MSMAAPHCIPRNIYKSLTRKASADKMRGEGGIVYRNEALPYVGQQDGQARPETKEAPGLPSQGFEIQNESAILSSATLTTGDQPVQCCYSGKAGKDCAATICVQTHCSTMTADEHPLVT